MNNILITGAAGYIGQTLIKQLGKDYNIIAIDNLLYGQEPIQNTKNLTFYNFDIRDYRELKHFINLSDIIIPLAAIVGMPACDKNPNEAIDVNLNSIARLVKMLSPNQRIIFPNTNSGYGIGPEGICTENTPIKPISVYGKSKCEAEKLVLEHPNSLVFRLATVFGVSPRMRLDLLVNDLVYRAYFDKKIEVFEPHARRNYVHVKDVAEAFIWAINNGDSQEVYNFGNDEANATKLDLVNLIKEYLKFNIKIDNTTEDPDKRDYYVSSAKIKNAGFKAEISLRVGIAELIIFYNKLDKYSLNTKLGTSTMRNA